jgi:hypothetical protein
MLAPPIPQASKAYQKHPPPWQRLPEGLLDNKLGDIQEVRAAPTGTSAAAAMRRLRKDRPDIHTRPC